MHLILLFSIAHNNRNKMSCCRELDMVQAMAQALYQAWALVQVICRVWLERSLGLKTSRDSCQSLTL